MFSDKSHHSCAFVFYFIYFSLASCCTVFCLSWLCYMCSFSSLPSPLLFQSWLQLVCFALFPEFRLQEPKLAPGCCFRWWRWAHDEDEPLPGSVKNADWMSSFYICSSPLLQFHHTPTHRSCCWCNFPVSFVCHLSPALSFLALLVCQPAIKACLCLPLPFLLSVTSSLFFISSLLLSDQ